MPTVLRVGPYRFFFYSSDRAERPHVHAEREAKRAKLWLDPIRVQENQGFSRVEINRIQRVVARNEFILLGAWHEFFGE